MPTDDLHGHTVAGLRAFASQHFPNRGAGRLGRAGLVALVIQGLISEELSAWRRATRRQAVCVSFATTAQAIRRRLDERYDSSLLASYFASAMRRDNEELQSVLAAAGYVQSDVTSAAVSPNNVFVATSTSSGVSTSNPTSTSPPCDISDDPEWPRLVPQERIQDCLQDYHDNTNLEVGPTCAVCARRSFNKSLLFLKKTVVCQRVAVHSLSLSILKITDEHIKKHHMANFSFGHPLLEGLALDSEGVHVDGTRAEIDICKECKSNIEQNKLPPLSLANGNVRGRLPPHLRKVTWLEERLCAPYIPSACVIRLYDLTAPGAPEHRARVMKGHTCSFPLHTVSIAAKLPRAFGTGTALVTCLVIGPRKPTIEDLRHAFKVRRQVVVDLFTYLRDNFKDYPAVSIDEEALNELPEDDVPELLMRQIIFEQNGNVPSLFDIETASLEEHPAFAEPDPASEPLGRAFLERHGMLDVNGVSIPAHVRTAAALAHASGTSDNETTGGLSPDLIVRHGTAFIQEYNNPRLFPGMYPTLFPWGVGGFELPRKAPLSFARQAAHLLDLADPAFRRHWSYLFVVANIKQRRQIHLGTRLMCRTRDFERVSRSLRGLDLGLVKSVSQHLKTGGSTATITAEEGKVLKLLRECQLVSAKVPGSKAVMNRARADIRGYIGEYGIFQLFLTLNPSPVHSPVFQVFYGDATVKLDVRIPTMPSADERATRVADDPVAASDYFHFHVAAILKFLLGWDESRGESVSGGGILGSVEAFFLVKEHTMRGQLHGHTLVWLKGAPNPRQIRQRLKTDEEFRLRYLTFFDEMIHHHLPLGPSPKVARKPRQERPLPPSHEDFAHAFVEDHRLLGEEVQRHKHTSTCRKGGRDGCRFLFPHEEHEHPSFDPETDSVHPRVKDPTVNWHSPVLLVATRHNHDLKSVQSGKSGVAAASYITSYTTKSDETPANQVSMVQTVFERMASLGQDATVVKDLLTRCVMQFGRERQVHAQQAATYVRDLGDTWQSHVTIPMLSGRLMLTVASLYGPIHESSAMLPTDQGNSDVTAPDEPSAMVPSAQTATTSAVRTHAGSETRDNPRNIVQEEDSEDPLADEEESDFLPLSSAGRAHQVDDYLHRGPTLEHLCFYDFVRCCSLVPLPKKRICKNHHLLRESHPNHASMCHRYVPTKTNGVPRPLFSRFPRSDESDTHGRHYCAAMLAHFRPFSISSPLKSPEATYESAFQETTFSERALKVMQNWAALTECDDARDKEELLRRKREAVRGGKVDAAASGIGQSGESATADIDIEALLRRQKPSTEQTLELMSTLASSNWFHTAEAATRQTTEADLDRDSGDPGSDIPMPAFDQRQCKAWHTEQARFDAEAKANACVPRATAGILASALGLAEKQKNTAAPEAVVNTRPLSAPIPALETIRRQQQDVEPHVLIGTLISERKLTGSQALAFKIAARRFFEGLAGQSPEPLRLFMHGEAGTGKTVVVRLLRELMERYGKGNEIRFVAPTGKAANAIGGSTQHCAFGLSISNRGGTTSEDLSAVNIAATTKSANRQRRLETDFADARWLFVDEVSMTSCGVLAEIDQSLRVAKHSPDAPFGGVNILFAGDLCQLPPVGAAALYSRRRRDAASTEAIPSEAHTPPSERGQSQDDSITRDPDASSDQRQPPKRNPFAARGSIDAETLKELGRMAWLEVNEVVDFTEQMRMKSEDMAAALRRLRLRECTQDDADLFNQNVLRSSRHPWGASMSGKAEAIVLTRTNEAVRTLNHRKATQTAQFKRHDLVICNAADSSSGQMTLERRQALLNYNGSSSLKTGLGRIPLYRGMPVVYRGGNLSVALGIANGAFATVQGWDVVTDKWGLAVPRGVVLRFSNEVPVTFSGLPRGSVPILPASASFKMALDQGIQNVTRRQLPIQPGFAMTVHSAQGMTSQGPVIVDLRKGGFEAYVAASRATCKDNLYLVAPVTVAQLNKPRLPADLRAELVRLAKLARATAVRHGHDDWRLTPPNASASQLNSSAGPSRVRPRDEDGPPAEERGSVRQRT